MGVFSDGELGLYSTAQEKKTNYRSMGRGSGGVEMTAKRKYSWRDPDFVSQPSIPGKFETVLYRGNNEDKGFGSQAPRFGQESRQSELPGPAAHGQPPGLASLGMADKAVGKRGHCAFSSRTPRQKAAHGAVQAPGPGAYVAQSGPPVSEKPTPVFVPPTSVNPARFNARAPPGPGDYSGAVGQHTTSKPEATGAYMTREGPRSDRGGQMPKSTPGPGAYDAKGRCFSAEPGSSQRGPEPPRRPWAPPKGWDIDKGLSEGALLRKSSELLGEEAALSKVHPGPGQYDPNPGAASGGGQTSFSTGESHTFRVGNSHKPRRWREQLPGPGQYEAPASPQRAAAAASFASASLRFKAKEALAPGPAYYTPRKELDNDFHLNPEQSWV